MRFSSLTQDQILKLVPEFSREFGFQQAPITRLGSGEIGGKAHGLLSADKLIDGLELTGDLEGISISIPRMVVLTTDVFDLFMERNNLRAIAQSGATDVRIAEAFQRGDFPTEYVGDLMSLAQSLTTPIAVRSSSKLEDALYRPFAGVYGTKMVPNNQFNAAERFLRLVEAIKYVYASTYFREARIYKQNCAADAADEKMAVILQEVVGKRHGVRFYPEISGVARSFNFYAMNWVRPEDGVIDLALGLGKTVVDGEAAWTFSPHLPHVGPPFNSISEMLKHTQLAFWAVNMEKPAVYDPVDEAEYLVRCDLSDAESDGSLKYLVSTFDAESGRIRSGTNAKGPRLVDFAPILKYHHVPMNEVLTLLLKQCERELGGPVEIEFAMTLDPDDGLPARLGFLQVRPIVIDSADVTMNDGDFEAPNVLLASDNALGNGVIDTIEDLLYVRKDVFDWKHTTKIAGEIEHLNARLIREGRNCILLGYGRWGTTDEWRGIPVHVGQISSARVIIEATLPGMVVSPSQGSHFFHNLTSFRVFYFSMPHENPLRAIAWDVLDGFDVVEETQFVRLMRAKSPFKVMVDGKTRRGIVLYG
jgi:hypothetical protein